MNDSDFPVKTRWTIISRAQDGADPAAAKKAFEGICRDYAPPLYAYARATGLAPEEATRLVNELFYRMTLELFPIHHPDKELPEIPRDQLPIGKQGATTDDTPLLERAEDYRDENRAKHGAGAGRFRDFCMLQIKTILRTDWRSQLRASQQGAIFSVADATEFEHEASDDTKARQSEHSPEEVYRRRWRRTLLRRARQALRERYAAAGNEERFRILWPLVDRDDADGLTSAQAGEQLGLTAEGVRSAVLRMKRELKEEILRQIADTIDSQDPADLEEEIRALFN